jgi:3-hydroxyisobutyrate dehydrogenase-like beta-hydroxyacid dehydrogenase
VAIEGVGEALRLADRLGVDRDAALTALAGGPLARTVTQKRQMIESGEFAPTMFSLELLAKDLALCLAASDHDAGLRATAAALESARAGVEQGRGGDDYARLADVVRRGGRG